jgi:hypothetical protein
LLFESKVTNPVYQWLSIHLNRWERRRDHKSSGQKSSHQSRREPWNSHNFLLWTKTLKCM